ncbi:MAG: HAD family hydrolase [Clostridiales bacterium]|nr:HAD family hydrolase [Clostridiales bacterium]
MKLIASDMDGTLLQNNSQQVSDRAIQLIQELSKKGYLFVAASGRQYPNLRRQFKDAADDMAFICENGAVLFYKDELFFESPMEHKLAMAICNDIQNRSGCEVLISGKETSYLMPKDPAYLDHMRNKVKNNVVVIDDFEAVPEPIVKISVFEKAGIVEHSADYFIQTWQDKVKCTVSGYGWLDFVNPDVNKGSTLLTLMKSLNIAKEDTYAFGDNYNDIEMLQEVECGYIMENAVDELKQLFPLKCKLVEDELEKLLL